MDKTILKNFAVESRKDLMDKIERKISLYYVDEHFDKSINGDIVVLSNDKHSITLTKEQNNNRDNLVRRILELGIKQVIEESTYTWFNRLVAIRYMEINDYLPLTKDNQSLGFRVLSSQDNTLDPEILKFTNLSNTSLDIDFNPNKYSNLTNTDEKFKYVLLLICKKLGKVIPQVFDGVTDYIDLLVPDNLLSNGSVLDKLIKIPEDNFKEVEVIGWLYQYYNTEEKDKAMAKKGIYNKSEIAYATQLFTPDWIVKYMVENSLGRYYVEHNGISDIINNWKYFIKDNVNKINDKIDVTKIKCIDPCSGSGHILVYMFEVLYQIYINEGYNKTDISELVLRNNLYGLDIDDRAGQLSILSVLLKAREYDKNIFNKEIVKNLNVLSLQESKGIDTSYSDQDLITTANIDYLIDTFKDAKEIGSLLKVEERDYSYILDKLEGNLLDLSLLEQIKPLIKQAKILSNKYDVVVTNPPYMPSSRMSNVLLKITGNDKYLAMINMQSWMFINTYFEFRNEVMNQNHIISLLHLGAHAFADIGGEVVQTVSFILQKKDSHSNTYFFKLFDYKNATLKEQKYLNCLIDKKDLYIRNVDDFKKIPGNPFAYLITEKELTNFNVSNNQLIDNFSFISGNKTGNNDLFLRFFWEIPYIEYKIKYFTYTKGGQYRKWYGNMEYVIDWSETAKNYYKQHGNLLDEKSIFKEGITYTDLTTKGFNARYLDSNCISDMAGPAIYPTSDYMNYYLGLLNSCVATRYFNLLNNTMHYKLNDVKRVPIIIDNVHIIDDLVSQSIAISKDDWDSNETSLDFKEHPLIRINKDLWDATAVGASMQKYYGKHIEVSCPLELCWLLYNGQCNESFNQLKKNEEELNEIFIEIYGLQDEMTSEVDEKDITIRKADKVKDVKSFISYAVGCMFGRYSLDEEGLIYAGGECNKAKYKTFIPDNDNIIPIADSNDIFYSDDIVGKFIKFVEITFGKDALRENLDYIAETLGKKGIETSEDTIRRYFLNDFYKDHLQIYQKRPIYWMFDSGKNNGFKCLIYMHRYNEQTVSKIKVDYFLKVQESYRNQLAAVQERLNGIDGLTTAEIKELRNKEKDLTDKLKECKDYYEKLDHIANEMIKIDLDDGVKVNYAKFEDILEKIK